LGLGLAETCRKGVASIPLSNSLQWLRIGILVFFLCLCFLYLHPTLFSSPALGHPATPELFSNNDFVDGRFAEEPVYVFDYVSVSSGVNLVSEQVTFNCVFSPLVDPKNVTLHLLNQEENVSNMILVETETNRFVHFTSFTDVGKYMFNISAEIGNQTVTSITRSFWITTSLSDKDADGMDDEWEYYYGFDSENPADAYGDYDDDGYKNLDEFTMDTDPLEADYTEFMVYHIQNNFHLIFLTILFLLVALLFSIVGLRRSTRWI